MYEATLLLLGKTYTAKGKTPFDAISGLNPQGMAKTKSILIVAKGKRKRERVLMPFVINRMFNLSPTVREVTTKNVASMFDL